MSSHREAPGTMKDPVADNTDVYAFVSPDRPDTVTLIANYIPTEYPAGGPFKDNWGLSLARARTVLIFLVTPNAPAKDPKAGPVGGGLNPKHWAASGYGETDPQIGSVEQQDKDQQQKNRRVELVVQPNVEEMLNLNNIK